MDAHETSARRFLRAIALAAGVLVYIVGCLVWIVTPLVMLTGNKWMTMSSTDWLKAAPYLLALPVGIALLCLTVKGYRKARMAASLAVPVPIIMIGVVATPGNTSPGMLITSGLAAALAVITLLRTWARVPHGPDKAPVTAPK